MWASIVNILLTGVICLVIIAALGGAQYFLSTRENRWLGLILPVLFMLYSMLMMVQVTIFSFDSVLDVFLQMLMVFFLCNIPTLVLVVIYAACRSKMEPAEDMEDEDATEESED